MRQLLLRLVPESRRAAVSPHWERAQRHWGALYALVTLVDLNAGRAPRPLAPTATAVAPPPSTVAAARAVSPPAPQPEAQEALLQLQGLGGPCAHPALLRCRAVGQLYTRCAVLPVPPAYAPAVSRALGAHLGRVAELSGARLGELVAACEDLAWPLRQLEGTLERLQACGDDRLAALEVVVETPLWEAGRAELHALPPHPMPTSLAAWGPLCAAVRVRRAQTVDAEHDARALLADWRLAAPAEGEAAAAALEALRGVLPEAQRLAQALLCADGRWVMREVLPAARVGRACPLAPGLVLGVAGGPHVALAELPPGPLAALLGPLAGRYARVSRALVGWTARLAAATARGPRGGAFAVARTAHAVLFHLHGAREASVAAGLRAALCASTPAALVAAWQDGVAALEDALRPAGWAALDALCSATEWAPAWKAACAQLKADAHHPPSHALWVALCGFGCNL